MNRIDIEYFGSIQTVKIHFLDYSDLGRFGTQIQVEYSTQLKQKSCKKPIFSKLKKKNRKNRNGVTSENVSSLPKKNLVVVGQKLRSVFCLDFNMIVGDKITRFRT